MSTQVIDRINRKANRIAAKKDRIQPGTSTRLSEAAAINDAVRQGDLYLVVTESIPDGFSRVESPKDSDRQLVPGNTEGARHCLDSLDGVELFIPSGWPNSGLSGPCFVLAKERTVLHPTHGDVTIPAGMTIQCWYQREYDAELRAERRNAD